MTGHSLKEQLNSETPKSFGGLINDGKNGREDRKVLVTSSSTQAPCRLGQRKDCASRSASIVPTAVMLLTAKMAKRRERIARRISCAAR